MYLKYGSGTFTTVRKDNIRSGFVFYHTPEIWPSLLDSSTAARPRVSEPRPWLLLPIFLLVIVMISPTGSFLVGGHSGSPLGTDAKSLPSLQSSGAQSLAPSSSEVPLGSGNPPVASLTAAQRAHLQSSIFNATVLASRSALPVSAPEGEIRSESSDSSSLASPMAQTSENSTTPPLFPPGVGRTALVSRTGSDLLTNSIVRVDGAPRASANPSPGVDGSVGPHSFSTGLDISPSAYGSESSSLTNSLWTVPAIADDSSGDIYAGFIVDVTTAGACFSGSAAGWSYYFAVSTNGGSSFTTTCEVAPTSGNEIVNPGIAVTSSGSDLCLTMGAYATSSTTEQGDYYFTCSTNKGGSWGTLYDGESYDAMCGASHGTYASFDGPVPTFDANGNLLVAFWGYQYPACSSTSQGIGVDVWSSPATATTHTSNFVSSSTLGEGSSFNAGIAINCGVSSAGCTLGYSVENTANTAWLVQIVTSTTANDFSAVSGPYTIASHAYSGSYNGVPDYVDPGGVSYAGSGTDAAIVYAYDTATTSVTYTIDYSYTTNQWVTTTAGSSPAGGVSGYFDPTVSLEGSTGAPFVSWDDATNEYVYAAPSQGGSFSGSKQTMSPAGYWGGAVAVYTPSTGPWRADEIWYTSQTTAQTYYSQLAGPSLSSGSTSPSNVDEYQSTTLSATATGGLTAYAYSYAGLPGCASSNTNPFTCSTSATGTFSSIVMTLTDSWGFTASLTLPTLTVNADPTLTTVAETSPVPCSSACSADAGQTLSVATTASLGSGTYTFTWAITAGSTYCSGSATGATTSTYTCTVGALSATQTWTITVYVTDSDGCKYPSPCTGGTTLSFTVSLYQDPTLSAVVETSPVSCSSACSADAGQSLSVATTASLGTGTYTFTWAITAGSAYCSGSASGATTSTYSCTVGALSATQTWTVTVYVSDSNGCKYPSSCAGGTTLSFTVSLYQDPSLTAVAETSPVACSSACSADAGQTLSVASTASLGTGTYTFTWAITAGSTYCSGSASGATTSTYSCTVGAISAAQTWTVTVYVSDSNGCKYPSSCAGGTTLSFTVTFETDPTVAPTPLPTEIITGQKLVLSANAAGGSGSYNSYSWISLPTGCTNSAASTESCHPSMGGVYTITVQAKDSNNFGPVSASITLIVQPGRFNLTTTSVPLVDFPTAQVGQTVTFRTTPSGGTGTYASFNWSVSTDGLGCRPSHTATLQCTPTAPGSYDINVVVVDSSGAVSHSATLRGYEVRLDPLVPYVVIHTSSGPITAGKAVTITATVTGGLAPYVLTWSLNGARISGNTGLIFVFTPPRAGTYAVTAQATDARGTFGQSTPLTLTASGPSLPSTSVYASGTLAVVTLTLCAMLMAALFFYILRRRERPGPSSGISMSRRGRWVGARSTRRSGSTGWIQQDAAMRRHASWGSYAGGGVPAARTVRWVWMSIMFLGAITGLVFGTAFLSSVGRFVANTAYISGGGSCPVPSGWSSFPPTGPTTLETGGALVYDSVDGYVVYFGGYTGTGNTYVKATWEYAGGCWSDLGNPLSTSPDGRSEFAMAWDGTDNQVLLFGGADDGSQCKSTNSYYFYMCGDTWSFSSGAWSVVDNCGDNLNVGGDGAASVCNTSPPPMNAPQMAYDPVQADCNQGGVSTAPTTGCVFLMGGLYCSSACDTSTEVDTDSSTVWEFFSGGWHSTTLGTSSLARDTGSLVYDAHDGYLLLYGGEQASCTSGSCSYTGGACVKDAAMSNYCDDAWSYTGGTWTQQCQTIADYAGNTKGACYPSGRVGQAMAYDAATTHQFVVLYGGFNGWASYEDSDSHGYCDGAFKWVAGAGGAGDWQALSSPGVTRDLPAMTYDSGMQDGYLLVLGGDNNAGYYDTSYVYK